MAIGDYALGLFAAGPYTASASFTPAQGFSIGNSYALGLTQDGWYVSWASMSEILNKTDRYGRAQIERFHQGCRMSVNCIFHEWKGAEVTAITPNSTVVPVATASYWSNGIVGSLGTDYSMALTLTARVNTPAAVNGPSAITFPKIKLRDEFDISMLFGPEHRMIPFVADCFLNLGGTGASGDYYAVSG